MSSIRVHYVSPQEINIPVQHGNSVTMVDGEIGLRAADPKAATPPFEMDEALHRFSDETATTLPQVDSTPETTSNRRYMARILGWGAVAASVAALGASHSTQIYDSVRGSLGADNAKMAEQDAKRDAQTMINLGERLKNAPDASGKDLARTDFTDKK